MDEATIRATLNQTEAAIREGRPVDLGPFWRVVALAKRDARLVERYGDQIGAIDRFAFEEWQPLLRISLRLGTLLAVLGTAVGLALIAAGYYIEEPWNGLAILAGTGVLLGTTHGLGHLIVSGLVRIRFIAWFVASITKPQPGVKTDYGSYLRAPARARAWMHASGAILTKAIPFLVLPAAFISDAPSWTWVALLVIGFGTILTDILWSTKRSDWKRFSREMAVAKEIAEGIR